MPTEIGGEVGVSDPPAAAVSSEGDSPPSPGGDQQGWRGWRLPVLAVGGALAFHCIVQVPHGAYALRHKPGAAGEADKGNKNKKKKRTDRELKVFATETVDAAFVAAHEPALRRAYELGFERANSGAAAPDIADVVYECRTMRCRLRVCGDAPGVNLTLRSVGSTKFQGKRLWTVFERGKREPQLEGATVCVDTIVRFAPRAPDADLITID